MKRISFLEIVCCSVRVKGTRAIWCYDFCIQHGACQWGVSFSVKTFEIELNRINCFVSVQIDTMGIQRVIISHVYMHCASFVRKSIHAWNMIVRRSKDSCQQKLWKKIKYFKYISGLACLVCPIHYCFSMFQVGSTCNVMWIKRVFRNTDLINDHCFQNLFSWNAQYNVQSGQRVIGPFIL